MAKKWKTWELRLREVVIQRESEGTLTMRYAVVMPHLTPTEARRLWQKLSGDYLD